MILAVCDYGLFVRFSNSNLLQIHRIKPCMHSRTFRNFRFKITVCGGNPGLYNVISIFIKSSKSQRCPICWRIHPVSSRDLIAILIIKTVFLGRLCRIRRRDNNRNRLRISRYSSATWIYVLSNWSWRNSQQLWRRISISAGTFFYYSYSRINNVIRCSIIISTYKWYCSAS